MNKKLIAILCCVMLTGCTTQTKTYKTKTVKEEAPVVLTTNGHDVKEALDPLEGQQAGRRGGRSHEDHGQRAL